MMTVALMQNNEHRDLVYSRLPCSVIPLVIFWSTYAMHQSKEFKFNRRDLICNEYTKEKIGTYCSSNSLTYTNIHCNFKNTPDNNDVVKGRESHVSSRKCDQSAT